MKTYAAYYDNEIRLFSSSGGIFSVLAKNFDVVYGAALSEDCYSAELIRTEGDFAQLRGSKYLQAKMREAFLRVKDDLDNNKTVLFTGTGCQINGLKCFLSVDYNNLTCLDIVCHGVPSSRLWGKYVKWKENQYGKVLSVNFRCKNESRKNIDKKKNQEFIFKENDPYMQMFLKDYCLRPSCYKCHAKQVKLSDLTIGDFWGIEKIAPEMDDGKGASLVIVRTEKGKKLFDKIKSEIIWKEVSYEDGVKYNISEYKSVDKPIQREQFFIDMNSMPFEKLTDKYLKTSLFAEIRRAINNVWQKVRNKIKTRNDCYGLLFSYKQKNNYNSK